MYVSQDSHVSDVTAVPQSQGQLLAGVPDQCPEPRAEGRLSVEDQGLGLCQLPVHRLLLQVRQPPATVEQRVPVAARPQKGRDDPGRKGVCLQQVEKREPSNRGGDKEVGRHCYVDARACSREGKESVEVMTVFRKRSSRGWSSSFSYSAARAPRAAAVQLVLL